MVDTSHVQNQFLLIACSVKNKKPDHFWYALSGAFVTAAIFNTGTVPAQEISRSHFKPINSITLNLSPHNCGQISAMFWATNAEKDKIELDFQLLQIGKCSIKHNLPGSNGQDSLILITGLHGNIEVWGRFPLSSLFPPLIVIITIIHEAVGLELWRSN